MGRLEPVEIRKAWSSESGDFTPWLANEHNLKLVSDIIGADLQLEATEKSVGPFRADILCKDTLTNSFVLIENQLEWTDHSHLGQLLTYAAGLDAATVIWIALKFTAEHRAALDWLNKISGPGFNFFGLEIEVWQIGDSLLAPKFNLVCQPNDWTKGIASPPTPTTELGVFYLDYWTAFKQYMDQHSTLLKARQPYAQKWVEFAVGRVGFALQVWLNKEKQWLDVSLVIKNDSAKQFFHLLEQQATELDKELGRLEWFELPQAKWCYISQKDFGYRLQDQTDWPRQFSWLKDRLEAFHRTFAPRVKQLTLPTQEAEYVPVTTG